MRIISSKCCELIEARFLTDMSHGIEKSSGNSQSWDQEDSSNVTESNEEEIRTMTKQVNRGTTPISVARVHKTPQPSTRFGGNSKPR